MANEAVPDRGPWLTIVVGLGLFVGTLAIFLIAPMVTYGGNGFPLLSLAGEFLLKDLVLFAASASLTAMASAREAARQARPFAHARAA